MRIFLSLALSALVLVSSCHRNDDKYTLLQDIDSYIELYPDSALITLQNIDKSSITREGTKALYSLLLSMALDKNYIDKTDFSVLQPAIDYYEKKGNPTEKLRMNYYKGRIFANSGNDEAAMAAFIRGLDYATDANDKLTHARTLFSKSIIHNKLYEYRKCAEGMLEAADLFKDIKRTSYFNALYNAHNNFVLLRDTLAASTIIDTLSSLVEMFNTIQLSKYYEAKIHHIRTFMSYKQTNQAIEEYLDNIPENDIQWLTVANEYLTIKEYKKGLEAIAKYEEHSSVKNARYYSILSRLHENSGNIKDALENYKRYVYLSDSLDMVIFKQNTKFLEERHSLQIIALEKSKQTQKAIFIFILSIVVLGGIIIYTKNKLKEKTLESNNYMLLCKQLEYEKDALLHSLKQKWIVKDSLKDVIMQRLSVLNTIMVATITDNYKIDRKAYNELNKLISNRESFMASTVSAFELSHPAFIATLRAKGLNDMELGYCCLYALGLNGKEIGEYTKMKRHYIVSHEIRKKLSLSEHDSNLGKHITKLLADTSLEHCYNQ